VTVGRRAMQQLRATAARPGGASGPPANHAHSQPRRLRHLCALVGVLLLALLPGRTLPVWADAGAELEAARAAAAGGDGAAAIAHLERAVAEDEELAAAYRWLSRLYAQRGLLDKALDSAAAAVLLDPDPLDQRYLARLVNAGMPESMNPRTPDALALEKIGISIDAGDDRLAAASGPREALVIMSADREAPATDPRFGWKFDRACHGYVLDRDAGRWEIALMIHYQAAAGRERRALAANCGGLLLRAQCLRAAYLGSGLESAVAHRRPLEVWLTDDGNPGAESHGGNIYLCAAATPRSPAEWVRQLIHEYGHVALPGIDHFAGPEPWANGRLGEQLFAQWLARCRELAAPHPWLTDAKLGHLTADADRCVGIFLREGPASALVDDTSAAGMDYYLGFANYVERAFGARVLSRAMRLTAGNTCRAFVAATQEALARASAAAIELRALQHDADPLLAHWVYLPAGRWRVTCRGGTIAFNRRTVTAEETDIGSVAEGWHSLALPAGATVVFTRVGR